MYGKNESTSVQSSNLQDTMKSRQICQKPKPCTCWGYKESENTETGSQSAEKLGTSISQGNVATATGDCEVNERPKEGSQSHGYHIFTKVTLVRLVPCYQKA